ncbi:unnamed protein product [Orchesella dallaii]|uniref:Nucleoprotein TPR/MLP1-2 domain-containing protein n=1 Tax=Orchesella dallaii TaxID=48710 RepID=A0ABP1QDL9_9HEXA
MEKLEDAKATIARITGEVEDLQSQVKVFLSNPTIEPVSASKEQPVTIPALERQIKDLKTQLRDAKIEIETLNQHLPDIQEKYEKELATHSSDTNTLNEVKIELESVWLGIIDEEQSRRNAENQSSQSLNDWTAKAQQLQNELSRLKESKEDLESLNTSLQDQIINLTTRLDAASRRSKTQQDR